MVAMNSIFIAFGWAFHIHHPERRRGRNAPRKFNIVVMTVTVRSVPTSSPGVERPASVHAAAALRGSRGSVGAPATRRCRNLRAEWRHNLHGLADRAKV